MPKQVVCPVIAYAMTSPLASLPCPTFFSGHSEGKVVRFPHEDMREGFQYRYYQAYSVGG